MGRGGVSEVLAIVLMRTRLGFGIGALCPCCTQGKSGALVRVSSTPVSFHPPQKATKQRGPSRESRA